MASISRQLPILLPSDCQGLLRAVSARVTVLPLRRRNAELIPVVLGILVPHTSQQHGSLTTILVSGFKLLGVPWYDGLEGTKQGAKSKKIPAQPYSAPCENSNAYAQLSWLHWVLPVSLGQICINFFSVIVSMLARHGTPENEKTVCGWGKEMSDDLGGSHTSGLVLRLKLHLLTHKFSKAKNQVNR